MTLLPSGTNGHVVAFIDMGTNSIRLLLVRIHPNQSYTVISQRKEAVRLGENAFQQGKLRPEAMAHAILVCKKFTDMAKSHQADEIIAVATAAARESHNQIPFLERLTEEANLDVRVISGLEEARLIYLGVSSGIHMEDNLGLFIDIGGGSTELIVGDQRDYKFLDTFKLGAIRLTNFFSPNKRGPIIKEQYALMQSFIRDITVRGVQNIQNHWRDKIGITIGSSGTVENLVEVACQKYYGRRRQPDEVISYSQLKSVIELLCSLELKERQSVPGINEERADIIIAGAAILDTLLVDLEIEEIRISDRGLRDGLLLDYLTRTKLLERSEAISVREQSVLRLGRALGFDEAHAYRVANLATQLFDSAWNIGLHELGAWEKELLGYAALLHDIGVMLSYSGHQSHSHYFIQNADLLGFDEQEIGIIATTSLYHRKAYPRKKHREFASLDRRSQEIVRVLCVFLSIAESLDRSHIGLVQKTRLKAGRRSEVILQVHASQECPLEIWGVEYHEKAFRKAFQRKLKVETFIQKPLEL